MELLVSIKIFVPDENPENKAVVSVTSRSPNCYFTNAVTVHGSFHRFVNCTFLAGATQTTSTSGDDQNTYNACRFGPTAGGSGVTLTISSGTNTIVTSCMTDAAISDSGTGTVLANNVVY